jgi:CDP-glycerol glycerophosphotransferase (TagB/SpsB family)
MLFQRRVLASVEHRKIRFRQEIPARYRQLDHIRIDTGSERSVDMSYTRNADLYIGDVSSQVYEFIQHLRPAIFLNSHGARWQDDPSYAFWKFGQVIDDVADLGTALERAFPLGEDYRKRQSEAFAQTFSIDPGRSSASRAAEAIAAYLQREFPMGGKT